jgi:aryl-alcohol dehydrogenase-like predicted oxidoreductase
MRCSANLYHDAAAQVKYSILDRGPERDGTIAKCRDLGVSVIAHSPLEQGALTTRALEDPAFGGKQAQQVWPELRHRVQSFWTSRSIKERTLL